MKGGCIYWYPQTILMGDMWFDDVFISVGGQNGDSGALWLDYDRRVHGMLFAYYYDDWAFYMRWQHVANAWTINIATHD